MNVLAPFNGISCGRVALEQLGIKVTNYYASEIDKNAIAVTQKNYPDTINLGDILNWRAWELEFEWADIDLILAGFPCQAWSIAGNKEGDNDPRGALVHTLLEVWNEVKKHNPNVKFLFENVRMKNEHLDFINNLFDCEPIKIDSGLVSAQSRVRFYWTNIEYIGAPEDKGILLKDILDEEGAFRFIDKDKSDYILKLASLHNNERVEVAKGRKKMPEDITIKPRPGQFIYTNHLSQNGRILRDKSATLVCSSTPHCVAVDSEGELRIRKLSIEECEQLQTLPRGYTEGIGGGQRIKTIGNGWTVDVIAHLLKGIVI